MREDLGAKSRLQLAQPDEMTPERRRIGVLAESKEEILQKYCRAGTVYATHRVSFR